jgi:hypothetical protein
LRRRRRRQRQENQRSGGEPRGSSHGQAAAPGKLTFGALWIAGSSSW